MKTASMVLGVVLTGAAKLGACSAMLLEAAPVMVVATPAAPAVEFVWDAAPEPLGQASRTLAQPIPEPRGWLLLLCGIGAILVLERRRPPLFK